MKSLLLYPAKRCLTAAGMLIYQEKVLLIKHTKLGIWLNPGGHREGNEALHQTAEREFWEETGIRVRAVDSHSLLHGTTSEYFPSPMVTNLHWVCQENYRRRLKYSDTYQPVQVWPRGCEQHFGFVYLVRSLEKNTFAHTHNKKEVLDSGWFALDELGTLKMPEDVLQEIKQGFQMVKDLD